MTMVLHYLKISLRSIYRKAFLSGINILGLGVGIAAALLIAKYVGFNLAVDNFHFNKDRIFLVQQKEYKSSLDASEQSDTYWGVAKMAVDLYPEVALATHFNHNVEMLVMATPKDSHPISFNENRICTVDTSFFSMFSFSAIAGNVETALSTPDAIVLTQSAARKYFGEGDPIGEMLTTRVSWGAERTYKVTCVVPDPPINSTLNFDFLISAGAGPGTEAYWDNPTYRTYLLLDEGADGEALSAKMSRDIGANAIMQSQGKRIGFSLKRLSNPHFSRNDKMLAMIGVFILVISWFNFVNFSISSAQARLKEMGVRKVVGSSHRQVVAQFLSECLLLNVLALAAGLLIFALVRPLLFELTGSKMLPLFNDPTGMNWLLAVVFAIGVVASSAYPAMVMSSLKPINSLKGKFAHGRHSMTLRKALVVAQFSISIVAAIGVFIVSDQLDFFLTHDPKIKLNYIVAIKAPKDLAEGKMERMNSFKSEAMNLAMVENVATSTTTPLESYRHEVNFGLTSSQDRHMLYLNDVDANFFSVYGIDFMAGENFDIDRPAKNRRGIILNKAAVHALGFANIDDAVGQEVIETENNNTHEIIGVVDDYHQLSLKYEIQPQAFRFNRIRGDISVKINAQNYASFNNLQDCISSLKELWHKTYPDQSFDYHFLDAKFDDQYHQEFRFKKLFTLFTLLSLIIACLGLFGLSLSIALKRRREVGIRKVFGASSLTILMLFTGDYVKQIVISIVLGAPIAYFIMKAWLEGFSYRTSINAASFLIPSLLLIVVAILTTAYQTLKASLTNPTTTLKDE